MKAVSSTFVKQTEITFKEKYMVGKSIGGGHFSEVRQCRDIQTGLIKAVKIYKKKLMDDYQTQKLQNEIEILSEINHPNILKLYELFEDDKRYYLIMEKQNGGELYDELSNRDKYEEEDAAHIV